MTKSVQEIVLDYLEANGFDGLYTEGECACDKSNLAPCLGDSMWCLAGYKGPCDCGDHDYHIGPKRGLEKKEVPG